MSLIDDLAKGAKKAADSVDRMEASLKRIASGPLKTVSGMLNGRTTGGGPSGSGGVTNVTPAATIPTYPSMPQPNGSNFVPGMPPPTMTGGGGKLLMGAELFSAGMGIIKMGMPSVPNALDYRLTRSTMAFQNASFGGSLNDRQKAMGNLMGLSMKKGTALDSMDSVDAARTLSGAGIGPGTLGYKTALASATGISNLMPGVGINGGAQIAASLSSAAVANRFRMTGINTLNPDGSAKGMNQIVDQLYRQTNSFMAANGVTTAAGRLKAFEKGAGQNGGLRRALMAQTGGNEEAVEAILTGLRAREQGGPATLLDKKSNRKLGISTNDVDATSTFNSKSFNALSSQSGGLAAGYRDLTGALGKLQQTIEHLPQIFGRLEGGLGHLTGAVGSLAGIMLQGRLFGAAARLGGGGGLLGGAGGGLGGGAVATGGIIAAGVAAVGTAGYLGTQLLSSGGRAHARVAAMGDDVAALQARKKYLQHKYGGGGFGFHDLGKALTGAVSGKMVAGQQAHREIQAINARLRNLSKHGDDGIPSSQLTSVHLGNQSWTVAKQYASSFQGFLEDAQAQGLIAGHGKITSSGGYNDRNIRGGARKSNHAFGAAIDVNAAQNALGATSGSVVPNVARTLAAKWHLRWGGDYKHRKDLMHFEIPGANGEKGAGPSAGVVGGAAVGVSAGAAIHRGGTTASFPLNNNILSQLNSNAGMMKVYDCSTYVQEMMRKQGVTLPDTSWEQAKKGVQVYNFTDAISGDLLFFHFAGGHTDDGSTNKINHVGIYIGNGKMADYVVGRGASTGYVPLANLVTIRRVLKTSNDALSGGGAPSTKVSTAGGSAPSTGSGPLPPHGGGGTYGTGATGKGHQYSFSQILSFAMGAGFKGQSARLMAAIAMGESGGFDGAVGDQSLANGTWGPSVGMAQVRTLNADRGKGTIRDIEALMGNPAMQMKAAYEISGHGTNFNPWTVYKKGMYKKFLGDGQTSSRANGGWNIPQDEFSRLHAGEMVLPSRIAQAVRSAMQAGAAGTAGAAVSHSGSSSPRTIIIKIEGNTAEEHRKAWKGIKAEMDKDREYEVIRGG